LINQAYQVGEKLGLAVSTEDEAGPFQTIPCPGQSWQPEGQPTQQPHEYLRNGTAKLLTLFHPKSGEVRVKGVVSGANAILHPWLKREMTEILKTLPEAPLLDAETNRACWLVWQADLSHLLPLPEKLPALRMLLTWDILKGHHTPELVNWLIEQGVMLLYTTLGGSCLNMAESIQRILSHSPGLRRPAARNPARDHRLLRSRGPRLEPGTDLLCVGRKTLTPSSRSRQRRFALGGSGACTHRPLRLRTTLIQKWQATCQMTH
jgi:hypothetical protein